jgi:hypothetical protein
LHREDPVAAIEIGDLVFLTNYSPICMSEIDIPQARRQSLF